MIVQANVHGAVSIVNAIAAGKGATLGIDLNVKTEIETTQGSGILVESENRNISSRLINKTVKKIISKTELEKNKLRIILKTDIPIGYGLKSSSAISSCIALACTKLFKNKINDSNVLFAGIDASIESRVSITGAYDDACACYYGGFIVTDNYERKIIHTQQGPRNLYAVIFIPRSRKRGNVKKLYMLKPVFENIWNMAKKSDYWNAMTLNGLVTSPILNSDPKIIIKLIENGALGASVSGNGPAVAAIATKKNIQKLEKVFSSLEGNIIVSKINNKKAEVHEL